MQGSRLLLLFSALLLLAVTTALATHSDEIEESVQQNEIDRDTSAPKNDLQTIKKLIYADENRHRELVTSREEPQVRTKRGFGRAYKRFEQRAKTQMHKVFGKPGSQRPVPNIRITIRRGRTNRNRHLPLHPNHGAINVRH